MNIDGNQQMTNMDMEGTGSPVTNDVAFGSQPRREDTRIVVIIHGKGQNQTVSVFAEVLGKPLIWKKGFGEVTSEDRGLVVGILASNAKDDIGRRDTDLVVAINAHCTKQGMPPDVGLSEQCDYEFLYADSSFFRRDLARFVSHTLGQINHHKTLMTKARTFFISTTFPDVRAALPNIDILTVGADAVELRVDLLKDPLKDDEFSHVPSLSYVGEQVMLLRQRTELPIIFTTRCTKENGRFPMDEPDLYYHYLYRAIQWGVEYIDVEAWLPDKIRERLWAKKGNSHIMSAFHDFSGTFKWPSQRAVDVFLDSRRYADIVKMIVIINEHSENFELEYFRSKVRDQYPNSPPLSAVNMQAIGQVSRTLNKVFTPITHPLLPLIAAPGQLSAAEINGQLAVTGQLPQKRFCGIIAPSYPRGRQLAMFWIKCFNELGLPHHFSVMERQARSAATLETCCNQKAFGGAYLNPAISYASLCGRSTFFSSLSDGKGPILSEAARLIGTFDTIVVRESVSSPASPESRPSSPRRHHSSDSFGARSAMQSGFPPNATLILDNASWRGILSTLTRDFAPSSYLGRVAVVAASSSEEAASIIYALKTLGIGKIYTAGFKTCTALARGLVIEPFSSIEDLERACSSRDEAFVMISALGSDKSKLVVALLRVFGSESSSRKVFLDLADNATPRKGESPDVTAKQHKFAAYDSADVIAFTTVETLRLLVGQNVPYSFVRLASWGIVY